MAISKCLRRFIVLVVAGLCMPSVGWSALKPGAVSAPDPSAPDPSAPTTYALFVGINGYQVGPVEDAMRDAHALFARMTDESLGLVRPEGTILLTEEEADGAAIDAALEDLLQRGDENDTVIFSWSGRSHYDLYADDLFLFPSTPSFTRTERFRTGSTRSAAGCLPVLRRFPDGSSSSAPAAVAFPKIRSRLRMSACLRARGPASMRSRVS